MPDYFPRDPNEWQGMRVDLSVRQAFCARALDCGFAQACVDGECWPCTQDAQCEPTEMCVLDHCVRRELAACRSRRDCPGQRVCRLTGLSPGPHSNADMRAVCDPEVEEDIPEVPIDRSHEPAIPAGPADSRTLLQNLKAAPP